MRLKRVGQLKETTKAQIVALEEEIDKRSKDLDNLMKERKMLLQKLEEIE